jgi:hypothetical protein
MAQHFVEQIEQRYQPALIKQRVLASQRRRLFLHETLTKGMYAPSCDVMGCAIRVVPKAENDNHLCRAVNLSGTS